MMCAVIGTISLSNDPSFFLLSLLLLLVSIPSSLLMSAAHMDHHEMFRNSLSGLVLLKAKTVGFAFFLVLVR